MLTDAEAARLAGIRARLQRYKLWLAEQLHPDVQPLGTWGDAEFLLGIIERLAAENAALRSGQPY